MVQIAVQTNRPWRASPDAFGNVQVYPAGWSGQIDEREAGYLLAMDLAVAVDPLPPELAAGVDAIRDVVAALRAHNVEPTFAAVWTEIEARARIFEVQQRQRLSQTPAHGEDAAGGDEPTPADEPVVVPDDAHAEPVAEAAPAATSRAVSRRRR